MPAKHPGSLLGDHPTNTHDRWRFFSTRPSEYHDPPVPSRDRYGLRHASMTASANRPQSGRGRGGTTRPGRPKGFDHRLGHRLVPGPGGGRGDRQHVPRAVGPSRHRPSDHGSAREQVEPGH